MAEKHSKTEKKLILKTKQLRKRKNKSKYNVFSIADFTGFGWLLVLPFALFTLLGKYLDEHYPNNDFSWTVNGIVIGLCLGLFMNYTWIIKAGGFKKTDNKHKVDKGEQDDK